MSLLSKGSKSNKNKRQRRDNKVQQHNLDDNYIKNNNNDDDEEQMLTAALFGTSTKAVVAMENKKNVTQEQQQKNNSIMLEQAFTFEIDRIGDVTTSVPFDNENDDDDNHINDEKVDNQKGLKNEKFINALSSTKNETSSANDTSSKTHTAAAWVDEDDEQVQISLVNNSDRIRKLRTERNETNDINGLNYQNRLRQRYISTTQLTSNTSWANITTNIEKDTKKDVSISTSYIESSSMILPPHHIRMKRCPDANLQDPNQSVTQVVQFHPSSSSSSSSNSSTNNNNIDDENPLLITAGFDKTLRFFKCNEETSTKVHGVHFPNFPIYSASFIGSSSTVAVTGRRPFFYLYDTVADQVQRIPKLYGREEKSWERSVASPYDDTTIALLGNDGYVILYDTKRKQCRTSQPIKLNGSVRSVAFANGGMELLASGSDGDIYRYDIRTSMSKCIERFNNLDGTITSYIASSRRTYAIGAESGVVNIYSEHQHPQSSTYRGLSTATATSPQHTPLKSIMNIKTSIDMMKYNHDGNILAISSRREKDCMKLVHLPTRTVYSNWPTSQTPLGYVWSIDFSPQSKYVAIGNDQGKCLLYKLIHYE